MSLEGATKKGSSKYKGIGKRRKPEGGTGRGRDRQGNLYFPSTQKIGSYPKKVGNEVEPPNIINHTVIPLYPYMRTTFHG